MFGDSIDPLVKVIIIACFFVNAFIAKDGTALGRRDQIILIIAMGLTLIADIFMVLLHMNVFGLLFFCMVQTAHNYRYTGLARVKIQVAVGAVAFVIATVAGAPLVIALGAAYAFFLFFSVTGSFMAYNKYPTPNNMMIVLGMLLFMGCDIFVGLQNLEIEALSSPGSREFIQRAIWLCYFPSQVLLSSSARKNKNYRDEDNMRRANKR